MKTYHAYYHMKLKRLGYIRNPRSLSVGHYELCRDNIGVYLGDPIISEFRENANKPSGCMKADILHKAIHLLC